jgi:hypothetical protein
MSFSDQVVSLSLKITNPKIIPEKQNESTFINIQVNTIGIHPALLEAYFQFGQRNVH